MDKTNQHVQSLISMAAAHIFDSFKVTAAEAKQHAEGLASLVESQGGDFSAFTFVQFRELVTKQLANSKLPWKTEAAQAAAEATKQETRQFYNDYLNLQRDPLHRKW
jgi:hypothetical protein